MKNLRCRDGVYSFRLKTPSGRREITIGSVDGDAAAAFALNIRRLADFESLNLTPDPRLLAWWQGVNPDLKKRVRKTGLLLAQPDMVTWADALDRWLSKRTPGIRATEKLVQTAPKVWDSNKLLQSFDESDALRFRQELESQGLSKAYVNRVCCAASGVFAHAIKRCKLDVDNPFDGIDKSVLPAKDHVFIRQEWIDAMLSKSSFEWRIRILLIRYLGLRAPSELYALRANHVDWDNLRVTIPQCKTRERVVPLFAELQEPLDKWMRVRGMKNQRHRIVSECHSLSLSLHTIRRRAGVPKIPRIFRNMRSTRATELSDQFPEHVVANWMGHSVSTSRRHYVRVKPEHFDKASGVA